MIQIGLYPHKCEQCGKKFEGRSEWAYKIEKQKGRNEYYWFCSHKCIRKYEELNEEPEKKPNERDQKILDLIDEGKTLVEIGRMFGLTYGAIGKVRDKWRAYE